MLVLSCSVMPDSLWCRGQQPTRLLCLWDYLSKNTGVVRGFPGGSDGKVSACNTGDTGLIPGLGRSPGEGNGNSLQYSYLEKSHGWRSLLGYSPWGRKESDMTERLHFCHFLLQGIFPTQPRDWTHTSCIAGRFFTTEPPKKPKVI